MLKLFGKKDIETEWIDVSPDVRIARDSKRPSYRLRPSPYDIPKAVRCRYNPESLTIAVDIKYLVTNERVRTIDIFQDIGDKVAVRLQIGRYSGRMYGVELDYSTESPLAARSPDGIVSLLRRGVNEYARKRKHGSYQIRDANFHMADSVLDRHGVIQGLATRAAEMSGA